MTDSPRWCNHCQSWGDHHTDRCWRQIPLAKDHPELIPADQWRDPGKPEPDLPDPMKSEGGGDMWDVVLYGVVAIACVALAIWLCTRNVNPCPAGWHERTTPTATVCTNPHSNPGGVK